MNQSRRGSRSVRHQEGGRFAPPPVVGRRAGLWRVVGLAEAVPEFGGRTLVLPAEGPVPPGGTTSVAASDGPCRAFGRKTRVTQRVAAVPAGGRWVGGVGLIRCVGAFSSPESGVPMEAGSTLSRRSGREDAGEGHRQCQPRPYPPTFGRRERSLRTAGRLTPRAPLDSSTPLWVPVIEGFSVSAGAGPEPFTGCFRAGRTAVRGRVLSTLPRRRCPEVGQVRCVTPASGMVVAP